MAFHGISLDAATTSGPGTAITPKDPAAHASMMVVLTGALPIFYRCELQGTIDGTNWIPLKVSTGSPNLDVSARVNVLDVSMFVMVSFRANLVFVDTPTDQTVTATIAISQGG